jgi:hypothetical protein
VSRSWELFLRDMLEAARKVIRFTADRQLESFVADEMAYDATLRNLELGNQQRVRFADGCINLNPARRADLDGTSSPGAGLHNLRDDEIWDDDAAIQRRQQLELRNACQGNQRSRIADDRALEELEREQELCLAYELLLRLSGAEEDALWKVDMDRAHGFAICLATRDPEARAPCRVNRIPTRGRRQ